MLRNRAMSTDVKRPDLLTVAQCANRLGVHRSTITRWVRVGILPAWRIGRTVRIQWRDVLAVAEGRR